jgi:hypothetical protein
MTERGNRLPLWGSWLTIGQTERAFPTFVGGSFSQKNDFFPSFVEGSFFAEK